MRSGVLLTGGKSTRMGAEKSLVLLREKPLVQWVFEEISEVVDEVLVSISTTPSSKLLKILIPSTIIVKDVTPGMGPIEGLLLSFKKAKGEYVAVAPCDTPFIKKELYNLLYRKANGKDGAVPVVNGFYEPLHAVYRRDAFLHAIEKVISSGKSKPIDAYQYLDLEYFSEDALTKIDPNLESFMNINTLSDMKKADAIS